MRISRSARICLKRSPTQFLDWLTLPPSKTSFLEEEILIEKEEIMTVADHSAE
jgi:hypothetical protein